MHEGDGGRLRSDGLRFESGEVEELNFEEAKEFQLDKLVKFPGFNAPLPDGVSDDSRRYNAPPFNRNQVTKLISTATVEVSVLCACGCLMFSVYQ